MAVDDSRVVMYVPGQGVRPFTFEQVVGPEGAQLAVYERTARASIISALNGFNACLFVYGQTGSGKTHTVFGPDGTLDLLGDRTTDQLVGAGAGAGASALPRPAIATAAAADAGGRTKLPTGAGLVLRALREIVDAINDGRLGVGVEASMSAQYVQIYNERLTDLTTGADCRLRCTGGVEGRYVVDGAVATPLGSMAEAVQLLRLGERHKRFAATKMNDHSSRAHTVLVVALTQLRAGELVESELHLVDLAGCEQLKQSGASGAQKHEAIGINSSLLVLKKVIGALVEMKEHVPYRESKLTMLLKGALGGASRTTAIITAAMDDRFAAQTVQSLRFGEAVARIVNSASLASLSVASALAQLDASLGSCRHTLRSLEARGKTTIAAYQKARTLANSLERRRDDLVALQQREAATE
jgi:kinesin family protein 5